MHQMPNSDKHKKKFARANFSDSKAIRDSICSLTSCEGSSTRRLIKRHPTDTQDETTLQK